MGKSSNKSIERLNQKKDVNKGEKKETFLEKIRRWQNGLNNRLNKLMEKKEK